MQPILLAEHLEKTYGGRGSVTHALKDLSLAVEPGDFVGVMGASGSGKTTLLHCLSTIDRPTGGRVLVDGREVTALKGRELARFRRERLALLNRERGGGTILLVTHDAFTASWCRRILFLRDGTLFRQLERGEEDRRSFFARIMAVVAQPGGDCDVM